ncbi:hypothetical protein ELQ90_08665 [Labedella phragmitis]|uniref:DUF4352 domain-containing protein n=1 Tax=Labedella phragmitis TaxID=2498849 RepID=A0A444PSP1_9MICO|nr:DUF4352 domain-containing protein [Labedella phragmitis]RWZ50893.1 hypothetical protein ELQ90_08665 [Labedella phragmitis]
MSDKAPVDDSVDPVPVGAEVADAPEAHSRRRALVILVSVVVLALVTALIIWSVTSANSSAPGSEPTSSAGPSEDASADPEASPTPDEEVPAQAGEVEDDILEFDDEAPVAEGVTVAVSDLESVDGEASMPGEIAGPSLRFSVTFTNDGDEAYSLVAAVTNVYYGDDQIPAIELAEPGGKALPTEVAPGKSATGTFVYNVPTGERDRVRITVDYAAADPAVVFEGSAPK